MTKKYHRKDARGILTEKERNFLAIVRESNGNFDSNERHYLSSIRNKTAKALRDLNLVFRTLPYEVYSLFSEGEIPSLERPIREVAEILYYRNCHDEFRETGKKMQEIDTSHMREKTVMQISEIAFHSLEKFQRPPRKESIVS